MNRAIAKEPPGANSFVANLKRVHENRNTSESRQSQQATSFTINPAQSSASRNEDQSDFDESDLAESEPLCPRIRLVKRYLSHDQLVAGIPDNTDVLTLTSLFKQVTPPDFKRPAQSAVNFVVLGIVATRSESRTSVHGNKYVTMTLSDLKYDISLALHGKALEKYWKVRPGTLIAVFNPNFYVQKAENVARNLALSVSKDACILEIGQAKDLGQCQSMTASSKQSWRCRNWVDVRRSHYCEFHLEQKFTTSQRPEFNSATGKLWDPRNRANGKKLTVIQGGEVKWKRGLQFDTQANQGRFSADVDRSKFTPFKGGMPDAPVGRVFQSSGKRKTDTNKYEEALGDKRKRQEREKWLLQRISDDNKITQTLSQTTRSDRRRDTSMVTKEEPRSQFGVSQMRKLGFVPKLRSRVGSAPLVPRVPGTQAPGPPLGQSDSDSDLEIV